MCGIVGGIGLSAPSRDLLESQLKSIEHRGPDDKGYFFGNQLSLGMCRLSIVEVASGQQPVSDATEKVRIIWNGEIYNYRELRQELQTRGVKFRSSSESEVLINLYLEYGIEFVNKINGMFAIALSDSRSNIIYLIRDRLGKKPLWYSQLSDGTLFFASEVRALMLARPDRTLRTKMISEVMQFGYMTSPNSAFNEIKQVPPSTVLCWRNGELKFSTYWAPNFDTKVTISYREALEITKELVEAAVSRRLISERPIGSFLSGGYDSTIVTAYMAKLNGEKINSYSIGFYSEQFNEAHHAKRVADYLGTNHHELYLQSVSASVVENISKVLDQPLADSSIIPTYLLSQFARENLVVALGGDGGDEVFGGYDRYLATPWLQKFNSLQYATQIGDFLRGRNIFKESRKLKRIVSQISHQPSLAKQYCSVMSLAHPHELTQLLNPDFYSIESELQFIRNFNMGDLSSFERMIRSDFSAYLPNDLLVKADTASMANSLELRSPFLDVDVVEWGLSLPVKFKIKGTETKHILKDVARSLVPPQLIDRPKMGFGIPRAEWLRSGMRELLQDTLTDTSSRQRNWFDANQINKIIGAHMDGQDLDNLLWPILMLELWARTWLD